MPLAADRPVLGISAVGPWILFVGVLVPEPPALDAHRGPRGGVDVAARVRDQRRSGSDSRPRRGAASSSGRASTMLMAVLAWLIGRRLYGTAGRPPTRRDELGNYRLLAPIGEGGMGEVWKASHEMLARQAAIKLVRPRTQPRSSARQADLWVERFRREANVIAGLQSPHTIYLYDFGVSRDGQFYYVMELLDGISLQTLVDDVRPAAGRRACARSCVQICASLEEAHQQSLVHRDLKPSNVMLCKLALTHDFVKVLDFGLAKCAACEDVDPAHDGGH